MLISPAPNYVIRSAAPNGNVLGKHGLLDVRHGGIVQLPVRMHHQCDRDEESNQQPRAPPRVVTNGNAESASKGHDSG